MKHRHITVRQWIATFLIVAVIVPIVPLHIAKAEESTGGESDSVSAAEETSAAPEDEEESDPNDGSDETDVADNEDDAEAATIKTEVPDNTVTKESSDTESVEATSDESTEEVNETDEDDSVVNVLPDEASTSSQTSEAVATPELQSETDEEGASSSVTSSISTPAEMATSSQTTATGTVESAEVDTSTSTGSDRTSETDAEPLASVGTNNEGSSTNSNEVAGTSSATTEMLSITTSTVATSTTNIEAVEENSTTSSSTPVTIESGQAVALANIINIVNTNFVNSDGVVFFSNFLDAINESIDFRWLYDALAQFGCSLSNCSNSQTTVQSTDTSTIDNYLYLEAISGNNSISGASSGVIDTGDAYAGLNLINVANMNFIDSNYLLVTMNAFNDVNGDLVFPSAETFLSNLAGSPSVVSLDTSNVAEINNQIDVDANSGGNTLETTDGGSITTGASGATTNVFNQINSSFLGGQNITILFRIHGDWVGEVFGAPPDLLWQEGADGSVFIFDSDSNAVVGGGAYTVATENSATINNNVQVVALTGENKITGTETGVISAGNAYAGANIVNLANGTVVGRNWILAIINIFGDFKGNIAFGRPDLWIGEMIDAPAKVREGSELTYKFSVINNGDSVASNVVLTDEYDSKYLKIIDSSVPYTHGDNGELKFNLGTLASGKAVELSYTAEVVGVGNKSREITNVVMVRSKETDNNVSDNTDTATIRTVEKRSGGGATIVGKWKSKNVTVLGDTTVTEVATDGRALRVERTPATSNVTSLAPVSVQRILLTNDGDKIIPGVQYLDVLRDPSGNIIEQQAWDLGNVLPKEQIELGYTITFEPEAIGGNYTFSSIIKSNTYEQTYANGTIVFLAESTTPYLGSLTERTSITPLPIGQVVSATAAGLAVKTSNLKLWLTEGEFLLPVLTAHSMSTVTEQHNKKFGNLTLWLHQLLSRITQLFAKIAPATKT